MHHLLESFQLPFELEMGIECFCDFLASGKSGFEPRPVCSSTVPFTTTLPFPQCGWETVKSPGNGVLARPSLQSSRLSELIIFLGMAEGKSEMFGKWGDA